MNVFTPFEGTCLEGGGARLVLGTYRERDYGTCGLKFGIGQKRKGEVYLT